MKNIFKIITAALCLAALVPMAGCSDMDGDGIDSVLWEGSQNPENKSFRNPVIEPSAEAATLFRGSSQYVILSATSQWTPSLTVVSQSLISDNIMNWTVGKDAFKDAPEFGERISSITGDYARTVARANNWVFYTVEGQNQIGAAFSATTAQGPYTDLGALTLNTQTEKVADPFFIVATNASFQLLYSTEDGVYMQELNLRAGGTCSLKGQPTLVAGPQFTDVCLYRESATNLYLFGVCNGEIRYARASAIKGPYLDKAGKSLVEGSNGEALIAASEQYANPENPMRVILNTEGDYIFLAYNATEVGNEKMLSGYNRRPVFLQPMQIGEDGWINGTFQPKKGWTAPRFE